jgi:hypothetical protein
VVTRIDFWSERYKPHAAVQLVSTQLTTEPSFVAPLGWAASHAAAQAASVHGS